MSALWIPACAGMTPTEKSGAPKFLAPLYEALRAEHLVAICLQTGRDKDRERVRILRLRARGREVRVWSLNRPASAEER